PFGDGVAYRAPAGTGPTEADLRPAGIGARGGALGVQKIKLFRDVYYSQRANEADVPVTDWTKPEEWGGFKGHRPHTLYLQPGHHLFLGDNSMASSDARSWGLVPERLLLGKAMLVYYPLSRAGPLR